MTKAMMKKRQSRSASRSTLTASPIFGTRSERNFKTLKSWIHTQSERKSLHWRNCAP